jgi:hypothetical protein
MNIKNTLLKVPAAVCCLFLFIQSVQSQAACTPVVYAFRHSEDVNGPPTALTPIGTEHANLYIEMIKSLEFTQNYCPVAAVYAVDPAKPDGSTGTTNPYFTARPLANIVMNAEPIIEIEGHKIGEFLGHGEAPLLLSAITDDLTNNDSVALFWTSQGMPDLANVLNVNSDIPADKPKPPRNAAYVFQWVATSNSLTPWTPTSVPHYVQCFNVKPDTLPDPSHPDRTPDFSSYKYYCGIAYNAENNPNLGGSPDEAYPVGNKILDQYLYKLHGRICNLANLNTSEPIAGYYGFCTSASKPPF